MNRLIFLLLLSNNAFGQFNGFEFGVLTSKDLALTNYSLDTSAAAVVLAEFGEAYVNDDNNLIFIYHCRIKILKQLGVSEANVEIPLYHANSKEERLVSVKASSFNKGVETKLESKSIFTENTDQYFNTVKFAVPNVTVGSIIEMKYSIESPYLFNFRSWQFQSHLPKIYSEYWATIPANYVYNVTLNGFLKLTSNESELVKDCFVVNGINRSDCSRLKFKIDYIPAFVEERYTTAKSNYISAINFQLSEIKYFDGRVDKITKEWKDVEDELRRDERFGIQLRRGSSVAEEQVLTLVSSDTAAMSRAEKIYSFVKDWFRWNEINGKYSELGIKKAFANRVGNVADINLCLVASLRSAGLSVEPVILSTRANGVPLELHPVLSDFNYVVAKVNIGKKYYLLDATDDLLPFGMLPEKCINGKGRVIGDDESYWIELKPTHKSKQVTALSLIMQHNGTISGTVTRSFSGYKAKEQREKIYSSGSEQEYLEKLGKSLGGITITKSSVANLDSLDNTLIETLEIEAELLTEIGSGQKILSPFILDRWESNPFKSNERLYPVDLGIPIDETYAISIDIPSNYSLLELPSKVALSLPNGGGRYLNQAQMFGNKLTVTSTLTLARILYSPEEYHFLKKLFTHVVESQSTSLVFEVD